MPLTSSEEGKGIIRSVFQSSRTTPPDAALMDSGDAVYGWVQRPPPPAPIQPGYEYEVFVSFRGRDTRREFIDSLRCSLDDAGIRTFFRDTYEFFMRSCYRRDDLRVGKQIGLREIEQTRISIPIFSKGYASSTWFLNEVAKMVECRSTKKQIIIPIFYDVTPYQVQHQTGAYAKAFSGHERNYGIKVAREWRNTLAVVGKIEGWDMNNYDGNHGEVVTEIVSEVLKQLKEPYLDVTELRRKSHLLVTDNLVGIKHEVFLSFRRRDTGREFIDSLRCSLDDAGIRTFFRDQYEVFMSSSYRRDDLRVGKQIILRAIEQTRIFIPILSKGSASSKWFLEEAANMVECRSTKKQIIIPIFYDVTPNQVQHQTGAYAEAFSGHERIYGIKVVREWRNTLAVVGKIEGWDINNYNGNHGEVVTEIVSEVLKQLKEPYLDVTELRRKSHLLVTDSLVGIEAHVEAITGLLDLGAGGVKAIGIYGTGGIGKTALVKAVYNLIVGHFEDASFLSDLQERSRRPRGLEVLQAQLLADLSAWMGEVTDVDEESRVLSKWLSGKKVLIVLDGGGDVDQLREITRPEWLGPGSRIIITGRDIHALRRLGLDGIHEVTQMHPYNAFRLFCKHAFRQDSPPDEFASISQEIAGRIGGHPLSIKVTGSSLCGRTKPAWEATLKRLRKESLTEVQYKLIMALDNLNSEAKEMFLDIACFFVGMDVRLAMYMWDDSEHGIRTLQELSLIRILDDNKLWMPNHLRDLGQKIVRRGMIHEPGRRSRLWGEDDSEHGIRTLQEPSLIRILDDNKLWMPNHLRDLGQKIVRRGMIHEPGRRSRLWGEDDSEHGIRTLQELSLNRILDDNKLWMPNHLRDFGQKIVRRGMIREPGRRSSLWGEDDSEHGIRTLQELSLIRSLDDNKLWMPNHLRDLGQKIVRRGMIHEPGRRSRLWGEDALAVIKRNTGTRFVQAICLDYGNGSGEHVIISNNQLKHMPDLRFLELTDASLCGDAVEHLRCLRWMAWHGNARSNIPSLNYPENLFILDLSKSAVNETWDGWSPNVEAGNLKALNLTSCHQLARTPNFSSFPHIEMLILKDCTALSAIDTSIGNLKKLKSLDLRNCGSLEKLPDEIGFLVQLEDLLLDECPIREIPISEGMRKLRTLSAKSCRLLTRLPQSIELLVGLEELLLDDCESLAVLPTSIGQLNSLKTLSLSRSRVSELPDTFQNSSNLKVLNIDHCPMRSFPRSLWKLERLEVLNASCCLNLCGEIPFELTKLNLLRILRLGHTSVTGISRSIVGLSRLETLDLEGCMKLQILPELPTSLVNLKVTRTAAEAVPNLIDLINLRQLETLNCSSDLVQGAPEEPSSSSSFALQPGYKYEVFISFRGPDTRKTFTDSLYYSLDGANIRTFRDDEELRLGEEIGPEILEAIQQSRVSIPIFSADYASSKWCLMEVAKMVECMSTKKQIIIPIFYDVAPDQVRHQTGTYAEAFSTHEKSEKFSTETVCKWRVALAKIGSLKGRDLTNSGYHGKVIREIVSEVLKLLKKPYLDVTEHLVGVEDHLKKVMGLLEIKKYDNRVVGICGMGGIGKTTIAKFIYNQLRDEFDCCSFLKDIREASLMSKGLESLQRQLASDVLRHKCEKFANTDAGKAELARSLRDKKVLILLDDVDKTEQLNSLVGDLNWLGRGSRIIITARNVDALRMSDVFRTAPENNALVYEVGVMHPQNAFLLFCKHAFRQDFPIPRFAIISWKIVEATGRLPLAVKAIASYLSNFQEKTKVWEEALRSLKTRTDILGILKISYEGLSREQREVFLDIVCLFTGMDSRIPVHVWKACGFSPETTIEDLLLRSLIRIGDNNELLMHDLYIELGREIIREESNNILGKYSRLWCREDAIRVLQHQMGTKNVRAVNLDHGVQSKKCFFSHKKFEKLSNVWFLGLGDANLDGNFHGCLSGLRWLSHHGDDFYIPDGLNLESLVVLDLSRSTISENWEGWNSLKDAENLEVLNLSSCQQMTTTPNFPPLPQMKRLILEDCRALSVVGPSIMELKALEFLDMRNCSSLEYLPKELGSLGALTELLLDGSSVGELPLSSNMENLEIISAKSSRSLTRLLWSNDGPLKLKKLFLDNCESLTDIPDSIGRLQSLTDLSLPRTSVSSIPESVGNLCNLELFNIDHCPVKSLPRSLWKLKKLEVISASGCVRLGGEIPSGIGNLTNLRILRLDHTNVSSIAPPIEMLRSLHTLNLKECKIRTFPNLPSSLVSLKVTCMSSVTIPNPSDLVHLKELEVVLLDKNAKVAKEMKKFSKIEKVKITIV